MAGSIYSWSQTADDNDDADGDINWQENQQPDTVNNSARVMMKRGAEYIADQGTQTVGGTANALTLTANSAFTAYANGLRLTVKAASTNTTAVTFNVNSIGNKAIRKVLRGATDVALAAGDIQQGGVYELIYDTAANSAAGAWILVNPALGTLAATSSPLEVASGGTGVATAADAMAAFGATVTLTAGDGLTGGGTLAANRTIDLGTPDTLTASTTNAVTASSHTHAITGFVPTTTSVSAGNGLTGGGTLAASRTITLGTPTTLTASTTNSVTTSSHTHAITGFVPTTTLITAGNGLTGGGALSTDRTVTLGTPTTLTMSTTNSVSGTTHSHALSGVAGVTTTSSAAETDFPIGHVVAAIYTGAARNESVAVCLHTTSKFYTVVGEDGDSTQLEGTWRARGEFSSLNHILAQRVA